MDEDASLSDNEEVRRLRASRMATDFCEPVRSVEEDLLALLEVNPRNRMAFEYLMAVYLLDGRLDRVAENIHRLDDLGYEGLPRHYAEALAMYVAHGHRLRLPETRPIGHDTFQQLGRIIRQLNAAAEAGRSRREALMSLENEFGDTYFFYCCVRLPHLLQAGRTSR